MIGTLVAALIANFPLTCLVLGALVALAGVARLPPPREPAAIVEKLLFWFLFFAIGLSNLVNFVFHDFMGPMTARYIGWPDSPFQFEVGTASLGFAFVGFLAPFRSFDMRLAAVLGPAVFLLGAALGHLYQMVTKADFAPGNAGLVFWMDLAVPLIGFVLLGLQWRYESQRATNDRPTP